MKRPPFFSTQQRWRFFSFAIGPWRFTGQFPFPFPFSFSLFFFVQTLSVSHSLHHSNLPGQEHTHFSKIFTHTPSSLLIFHHLSFCLCSTPSAPNPSGLTENKDEVPTLSDTHPTLVDESLDSQSQADMSRTRNMSISIPMSSMESYETGNNLVGSTSPLRSARRAPLVHRDMKRRVKVVKNWDKFFVICCLVAIFLDPLFFFLLSVQQDNKCIAIDWPMTKTIVVFRSLTDFVYLLNILFKFWLTDVADESRVVGTGELVDHPTRIAQNYLKGWFFVDLSLVLPLPQIMVLLVLPKSLGSSGANYAKNLILSAVLIQYIPRLFRFLPLLVGKSPNGLIFETAWANFFINLFTFLLSGHVIGSCWYLFGLQRVKQCLRNACDDTGLGKTCLRFIDCGDGNARNGLDKEFGPALNWTSWTKNENATACFSGDSFGYGIYKPAVKLTSEDITERYVYSLFWGFQQISTLAGNQQPSYFVWEVLFTMLIIGLGLLLFAFLIGNMQNFLQALGRRRLEFSLRQRDVEQWMRHRSLPKPLKKRVRAAEKYNWAATRGVHEGMLIENLPEDIQRDIRRHMFSVRTFALMDRHILDAICERLKRTIYIKGSEILYSGSVLDNMVFIVDGKLESIADDGTVSLLCKGSVCGKELLTWFLEHASISKDGKKTKVTGQRLHSNRTVRCVTNVEAFLLRATDLEEVTDYFASLRNHEYKEA